MGRPRHGGWTIGTTRGTIHSRRSSSKPAPTTKDASAVVLLIAAAGKGAEDTAQDGGLPTLRFKDLENV